MNEALTAMFEKYNCVSRTDYENAFKEIIQELALLGLWRTKFFEHAAFYGGTALRILYGLDRFSEDLDFSLLSANREFRLAPYLAGIGDELKSTGIAVEIIEKVKSVETFIDSAFIKADTREHFLRIAVPDSIASQVGRKDRLRIKIEVDTDPPSGFEVESKTLLQPIPFSVNCYKLPDLFAGKLHALLERGWSANRVKGRDYYDFVWYVGRGTPVRLGHLEQRLRQTGGWSEGRSMTDQDLRLILTEKFSKFDVQLAKQDILPFIKDPMTVALWSNEFFLSLVSNLRFV